jgi:hypothetical protein
MKSFIIFILIISYSVSSCGEVSRIENFNIDRKRVNKIYLSYSKTGVVRFPDEIEEVRVGAPEGYKYEVSKTFKRELSIKVSLGVNAPSNLIVRTSNEDIYVFDLVPSSIRHQDVVFVDESFYKTKSKLNRSVKRKIIYSNTGSLIPTFSKSQKKLIYTHKPKNREVNK